MVRKIRIFIAHILDKFDHYILQHRFHFICNFIALKLWPNEIECKCVYCEEMKEEEK